MGRIGSEFPSATVIVGMVRSGSTMDEEPTWWELVLTILAIAGAVTVAAAW
ncbi:hypothetical protein [Streptomyces sp. NPDC087300]|uniref:hypothetical protein n=1 Tax=Streptomyces sp. NPDC087300 TaxID=3365780 RepID=UPI0037FFBBB3